MSLKMLSRLPTELVHLIYRMYFSWVLEELLDRRPRTNDFIVRTSRSNTSITEVKAHFGVLYLIGSQTSKLYREGIQALPLDLELAYFSDSTSNGGGISGYVSPSIRNLVRRRDNSR
jgi:hypothetical protein